jgi:hypothetical protein
MDQLTPGAEVLADRVLVGHDTNDSPAPASILAL